MARVARRAIERLRTYGLLSHLLGACLRFRFHRAGVLLVRGGWALPTIDNLGGRIEVGNCTFFPGVRLECWRDAEIRIGDGTYLNRNVEIVAAGSVIIGRNCKVARDVIIMDTDQHALPGQDLVIQPVVIEDGAWLGARALILKGVTIGRDAVVAAGAIVTGDVPPRAVVAGNPARVLRQL